MTDIRKIVIDYEAMYRAVIRRLVEIANDKHAMTGEAMTRTELWRLIEYDRVARAHEPNIKEEDDVS